MADQRTNANAVAPGAPALAGVWRGQQVVVCVGTGGVGKTTVAAALAMAAAKAGRRVLVMTIDPSKRLAQSLGIDAKRGEIVPIAVPGLSGSGSLHALVLDVQSTFDQLIDQRAKSALQAQAIKQNRIYRHFSASLAGSHEYAAVEKLWDGVHDDRYDLVVLDTPPAQNALDFLQAPRRILDFLQGQSLVAKVPGGTLAKRFGKKLFGLGGSLIKSNVAKIAGTETLDDVLAFLRALTDMYDSFCERAQGIEELLQSALCTFVLVGSTSAAQAAAIARFESDMATFGIRPRAYVLNRLRALPLQAAQAELPTDQHSWQQRAAALVEASPERLTAQQAQALALAIVDEGVRATFDASAIRDLRARATGRLVVPLYEQAGDVDRPAAIAAMADALASGSAA